MNVHEPSPDLPKRGRWSVLLLCLLGAAALALAEGASISVGSKRFLAPQGFLALAGFVWFLLAFAKLIEPAPATVDLKSFFPVFLLALVKVWLVSVRDLTALGPACHDDRLFLRLAGHLRAGKWLGDYDNLTLAKGPFYSMWIALGKIFGLPLLLGEHLFYIAACVVLVVALRPLLRRWALLILFAALVFNPMTFSSPALRVCREAICVSETLLVFACLIGLHTRRAGPLRAQSGWAIGLGLALASFWLTREEGLWLMPSVALLLGFTAFTCWRSRPDRGWSRLALCGVPFVIWGIGIAGVCGMNWFHYGIFTTCEVRSSKFVSAYGALTRVKPATWQRYVPVAQETRQRIYAVSPAFRELEPFLEGELGKGWAVPGAHLVPRREGGPEIAAGWFMWAFRDAVACAGHYESGRKATRFYRRLAREVNAACDAGVLPSYPARATMMPPWHDEYGPLLLTTFCKGWALMTGFGEFSLHTRPSWGPEAQLRLFHKMTSERFAPMTGEPERRLSTLDRCKLKVLAWLGTAYQKAMPAATWLALAVLLAASVRAILVRRLGYLDVVMAAALAALVARVLLLALVDITSFNAFGGLYLLPAYPILVLLASLGLYRLHQAWSRNVNVVVLVKEAVRRFRIRLTRSQPRRESAFDRAPSPLAPG